MTSGCDFCKTFSFSLFTDGVPGNGSSPWERKGRKKTFETKKTCGKRKGLGQGLGGRNANTDGPFINFLKLFFLGVTEISQGGNL